MMALLVGRIGRLGVPARVGPDRCDKPVGRGVCKRIAVRPESKAHRQKQDGAGRPERGRTPVEGRPPAWRTTTGACADRPAASRGQHPDSCPMQCEATRTCSTLPNVRPWRPPVAPPAGPPGPAGLAAQFIVQACVVKTGRRVQMDAHKCAINFRCPGPAPSGAAPGSRRRPGGASSKPPSDLRIMVQDGWGFAPGRRPAILAAGPLKWANHLAILHQSDRCRRRVARIGCDGHGAGLSRAPHPDHHSARPRRRRRRFTRALADELQKALGQPVVVDNRPGGGLNIGARACAESPPDGYTICVMSSEPVIYNQFLFKSLAYDPEKDFEPIAVLFVDLTLALVVNSALKVRTIPDLVALSRARPGTLSYGTFSFALAQFIGGSSRKPAPMSCGCRSAAATALDAVLSGRPRSRCWRLQHRPAAAERPRHRAHDRERTRSPLFPVSRPSRRPRGRTIRRPGRCSRRPAPRRRSWRSSPARLPRIVERDDFRQAHVHRTRRRAGSLRLDDSRVSSARTASPPSGSSRSRAGTASENSPRSSFRLMWRSRRAF